jgi:hypothetical protein
VAQQLTLADKLKQEMMIMSLNSRLADLLDYMLDVQLTLDQQLPDEERTRTGTYENWSIKDTLAHNAEWANHHLAELETLERGEPWPERDDDAFEDENRVIFERYERISWDDLLAMLRDSYGRGRAYLGRMSEDGLMIPLPADPERTVWRYVAGEYVTHPMIHIWDYLVKNGHRDLLAGWFGKPFAEQLLALSDDDQWQGTIRYNQACLLALSGMTDQAIEQLAEGLALAPGLKEWSQQDSDLDSLREEPAYQALYD